MEKNPFAKNKTLKYKMAMYLFNSYTAVQVNMDDLIFHSLAFTFFGSSLIRITAFPQVSRRSRHLSPSVRVSRVNI